MDEIGHFDGGVTARELDLHYCRMLPLGVYVHLKEVGGVYLSKIGLSGNALRGQVKKVHEVHFLDELGKTEATWIYEVENFGPFFVAMDTNGRNYFEELAREADAKMPEIEKKLGIPEGYDYTEVNG